MSDPTQDENPGRPLRVLLMISSMNGGGSEQQTLMLLRNLDRTRFQPHLYLLNRTGTLLGDVPDDVAIDALDDQPDPGGLYYPGRQLRRQTDHAASIIRKRKIDVVYDRTFHMTLVAGPAAKACGVKRISTIVSPPDRALSMVESRFIWLKRRRLSNAYRDAFRVVAVSRQAAQSAGDFYRLGNQAVDVIPNPVDVDAVRRQAAGEPTFSRQADALELVCVGRMTAEKGHRDLVDAMIRLDEESPSMLPKIRLHLIGDGPLRSELEQRACRIKRHSIDFHGHQRSAAPSIAGADALVLPSHFEGMPNVVLEAMALGVPVIATLAGGTVELEQDESTILWAQPGSPDSLCRAIEKFAVDGDSAKARVLAAHRLIDRDHNLKTATGRIQTLLAEAASAK